LLIAFVHQYQRRKSRQLYLASANTFDPIGNSALNEEARSFTRQAIDEVDFSLTQNGLSDSMSVTDLSQYDVLETGADGELVLEQAKIYAHIGRSDEAIELLRNHIDSKPKASLHHRTRAVAAPKLQCYDAIMVRRSTTGKFSFHTRSLSAYCPAAYRSMGGSGEVCGNPGLFGLFINR
jgi:hypothetical protein